MDRTPGHLAKDITNVASSLVWIKVVGIGNAAVGKTCLIKHFCESKFTNGYQPTVGVDYGFKIHNIQGLDLRVHLWDLSGNAEYVDVRNELYGGTDAVFLVYDVTNQASFDNLEQWLRELTKYASGNPEVYIVANKVMLSSQSAECHDPWVTCLKNIDQKAKRVVSNTEGKKWAAAHKLNYCETSSSTGEGVETMFGELLNTVVSKKRLTDIMVQEC